VISPRMNRVSANTDSYHVSENSVSGIDGCAVGDSERYTIVTTGRYKNRNVTAAVAWKNPDRARAATDDIIVTTV
jgi:hypothetical protein